MLMVTHYILYITYNTNIFENFLSVLQMPKSCLKESAADPDNMISVWRLFSSHMLTLLFPLLKELEKLNWLCKVSICLQPSIWNFPNLLPMFFIFQNQIGE